MTLDAFFQTNPRTALAFSGGVDSAYLLWAGVQAGTEVQPYFVKTPFQPQFELEDARRLCGQLGVWTGWLAPSEAAVTKVGAAAVSPTAFHWIGLVLICFVLPAVLSVIFCEICRTAGWIKEGDLTLPQ